MLVAIGTDINHCPGQRDVPLLRQTNQGYKCAALDMLYIFHPTFKVQTQQPYLFASLPKKEKKENGISSGNDSINQAILFRNNDVKLKTTPD